MTLHDHLPAECPLCGNSTWWRARSPVGPWICGVCIPLLLEPDQVELARRALGGVSVMRLRNAEFTPAPRRLARRGIVGWARCRLGGVVIDGLALRRTARGHYTVTFPTRRDGRGREHAVVRPVDRAAREAIRLQVLAAAGLGARS